MIEMMKINPTPAITPEMTVAEIMDAYPQTISVFVERKMICVGCAMADFDTLSDAATNYGITVEQLLEELRGIV